MPLISHDTFAEVTELAGVEPDPERGHVTFQLSAGARYKVLRGWLSDVSVTTGDLPTSYVDDDGESYDCWPGSRP